MNTLERTVSALENKKKETIALLEKDERNLGNQLLTAGSSAVNSEDVSSFNTNAGTKQKLLRDAAEIERLAAKLKEAKSAAAESGKCVGEFASLEKERHEVLGKALYDNYETFAPDAFTPFYNEAKLQYGQADELQKKANELQSEIEKSPFLSRLIAQVKLSSINTALSSQLKKASAETAQGAAAVLAEDAAFASESLPETVKAAYDNCISLQQDIQKQKDIHNANIEEESSIKHTLLSLGVTDSNGKKRLSQIKAEIDKLETFQAALCHKAGHSYADLYCTKDGEPIVDCTGLGADIVASIQTERANLFSYNRRMDIIQLSTTLEEADRRIAALKRDAASIKRQIALLEENSAVIEEKIAAASATRDLVVGKRAVLENEEVSAVKRLKEKDSANSISSAETETSTDAEKAE